MRRSNSVRFAESSAARRALRALAGFAPGGKNVGGNFERRMRPAELLARALDFVGAERRTMRGGFAGLARRAKADGRFAGDHHRLIGRLRLFQRSGDGRRIVPVDARGRPAGGLEAFHLVDRVGERQRAVDRDAVVVEQHDQPVELQVTGERN